MKANKDQTFDEELLDDEIDLVKLVSSSSDIENQYVVFEGSNNELYAINVAKVEELLIYEREHIVHNNAKESIIIGTADIREHMTPLFYFDQWFGNEKIDDTSYELVVLCYFSQKYLGVIVKQVVDIMSISPQEMYNNSENNELTTFVAKIALAKEEQLCTIFDTDKLLFDLYGEEKSHQSSTSKKIESDKLVLFADDSKLVSNMAYDSFERLGLQYRIYHDGQELLDALDDIDAADIGLFLLDVEMPRKTGIDVVNSLNQDSQYADIPIIVHTNMANRLITELLQTKGIVKIISKIDFKTIENAIEEYML